MDSTIPDDEEEIYYCTAAPVGLSEQELLSGDQSSSCALPEESDAQNSAGSLISFFSAAHTIAHTQDCLPSGLGHKVFMLTIAKYKF